MWSEVKRSWLNFLLVLIQPQVVLLILLVIGLEYFSVKSESVLIKSFLTTIIAILAGYCGACIDSELCKMKGSALLITQGKNAVRNLKLLQSYLQDIYTNLLEHKNQATKEKSIKPEVSEIWLNETIQKITMVQKLGINAIENWSSWIPETDITTQLEKRDDLQKKISDLGAHIATLELNTSESEKERAQLKKEREQLKNDLSRATEELQQRNLQLDRSLYGLSAPIVTASPSYQGLLSAPVIPGMIAITKSKTFSIMDD